MRVKTGIGQDSHRFDFEDKEKPLLLGGVHFPDAPPLSGNSDADVVLHAVTNAVSGVTGVNILGAVSDDLCMNKGIRDSRVYLEEALKHLGAWRLCHVSISLECRQPKITPRIAAMKQKLADLCALDIADIGITATSGEGLTAFGRGEGIQVFACVTVVHDG